MNGRTVIVTGANSGIGFETAAGLAAMGAHVVVGVRDRAKGEDAADQIRRRRPDASVKVMEGDLANLDSVRAFTDRFLATHHRLDVLVNNAGLMTDRRSTTVDGYETQFQVNHLAPFLLTNRLLGVLKASAPARIVNVASVAHTSGRIDFGDLQTEHSYSMMRVYSMTKLCNMLFTRELARLLEGTGVTVNALHPGTVRTGVARDSSILSLGMKLAGPFILSPAKGARTSIYLASSPEVEGRTGGYYVKCRPKEPASQALNDEEARKLWEVSERLTGL